MNLTAIQGNIVSMRGNLLAIDARKPFVFQIDTTKGNGFNTFTLPLTNHFTDVYVKTSDGQRFTISNYLNTNRTINFASAGVYTIELRGQCGWSFNNTGDCQKLSIKSWGDFQFNYLAGGFYGCINLTTIPQTGSINAPNITSIRSLFSNCKLSTITNDDTFKRCTDVTLADYVFYNNELTSVCQKLLWPLVKLLSLDTAFQQNLLTSVPVGFLDKNAELTNIRRIFRINLLQAVDPYLFKYTTKVINASGCLDNNRLTSVETPLFSNMLLLTNVNGALSYNYIRSVGEDLFVNNKNITDYGYVLASQSVGFFMPLSIFDLSVIYKVTNWTQSFYQIDTSKSHTGTVQPIWDYASETAIKTNCFLNDTQLTNYNDIPNEWKGL